MLQKTIPYIILMAMALTPVISDSTSEPNSTKPDVTPIVDIIKENRTPAVDAFLENPLIKLQYGTQYSSQYYSNVARELASRYPEILSYKTIGSSHDGKDIYSLVMTSNVEESMDRDDFNTFRMHYLIEAGIHGRETVNPAVIIKQIEDYAADYYRDSHIADFKLKDILSESVFHFIPLVNPDGHDLAKFGPDSIKSNRYKNALSEIYDEDYSQWKANISGVDLNKNFPDYYLEDGMDEPTDKWQKYPGDLYSNRPDGEYYPGEYPGSEPETQALMEYMKSFDFRSYLSYHSRGDILYYEYLWYPDSYLENSLEAAKKAEEVTGYRLVPDTGVGSGYSTSYHVALSLKPSLTVETLSYYTELPSGNSTYLEAYEETWLLPLHIQKLGKETGYFPYRLYVDGRYVRDFPDETYAKAMANSLDGEIIEGSGIPGHIID
ncbi:MAG: M14 family zinc carboxypeptidase [Gudongella sp.]|nr:M14 family zinc carboxypeptidase [Gudongella sp.]